jgi:hypothetical protein
MFALLFALFLGAQSVTIDDVQQMQATIDRVSIDVAQLRGKDPALSGALERDLDRVRDDVAYLRVKLRRNEAVPEGEFSDVRSRLDDIRIRARGESAPPPAAFDTRPVADDELPVGTEFDIRLQRSLSSATARVEDRFDATTVDDLRAGDRILVPAGSLLRGYVSAVTKTTRVERKGELTLAFDRLTIDGRIYDIRATVVERIASSGIKGEAGKIGIGAGVGGIIGGLLGGAKGAIAGILIGGGGTLAATEGKDVEVPAGTVLRVRLDTPLDVDRPSFN